MKEENNMNHRITMIYKKDLKKVFVNELLEDDSKMSDGWNYDKQLNQKYGELQF